VQAAPVSLSFVMAGPSRAAARLIGALALALLVAPGTWLRTVPPAERIQRLAIDPLEPGSAERWPRGLAIEGLWELAGPDLFFGGYSALVVRPGGRALAFSDLGETLAFTLPGHGPAAPRLAPVRPHPRQATRRQDIESATLDPRTGQLWIGYEQVHAVRRIAPSPPGDGIVLPAAMANWPRNSGAEALVRLADGRFLALAERNGRGMLFAGDPVDNARVVQFAVAWPEGHRPVDAAQLPDGRVLVLTRKVEPAWPPFGTLLLVGEPGEIAPGKTWRPRLFARLDGPLPRENYEALAVERTGDGAVLWLMSDDNFSTFQRTLLARLRWRG